MMLVDLFRAVVSRLTPEKIPYRERLCPFQKALFDAFEAHKMNHPDDAVLLAVDVTFAASSDREAADSKVKFIGFATAQDASRYIRTAAPRLERTFIALDLGLDFEDQWSKRPTPSAPALDILKSWPLSKVQGLSLSPPGRASNPKFRA